MMEHGFERILEQCSRDKKLISNHFLLSIKQNDGLHEMYLSLGADVNVNDGEALKNLVDEQRFEILEELIPYGADLSTIDLSHLVEKNNYSAVEFLLKNNIVADVKELKLAIENNNADMVCLLLNSLELEASNYSSILRNIMIMNNLSVFQYALNILGGKLPRDLFTDSEHVCLLRGLIVLGEKRKNEILKYLIRELFCDSDIFSLIYTGENKRMLEYDRKNIVISLMIIAINNADYEFVEFLDEFARGNSLNQINYDSFIENSQNDEVDKIMEILLNGQYITITSQVQDLPFAQREILQIREKISFKSIVRKCSVDTVIRMIEYGFEANKDVLVSAASAFNLDVVKFFVSKNIKCGIDDIHRFILDYNEIFLENPEKKVDAILILKVLLNSCSL